MIEDIFSGAEINLLKARSICDSVLKKLGDKNWDKARF